MFLLSFTFFKISKFVTLSIQLIFSIIFHYNFQNPEDAFVSLINYTVSGKKGINSILGITLTKFNTFS